MTLALVFCMVTGRNSVAGLHPMGPMTASAPVARVAAKTSFRDELRIDLRARYTTLIIGLIGVVAVSVWAYRTTPNALPKDVVPVSAAALAAVALIYAAHTFNLNVAVNEQRLALDRQKAALEIMATWTGGEMTKQAIRCFKYRSKLKGPEGSDGLAKLREDEDTQMAFIAILNYLERLALVVHCGFADEDLLREYFAGILHEYFYACKPFVDDQRVRYKDAELFGKLEALEMRWQGGHSPSAAPVT